MPDSIRRFAFLTDLHWGFENRNGHKKALHDPKAWDVTLQFLQDFKPHDLFLGGDILDCGAISHHNKAKPRKTEGFRLLKDAEECVKAVIEPLEALLPPGGRRVYQVGNHEQWLDDFTDENPTIEGTLSVRKLLQLSPKWEVIEQGYGTEYGKLYFIHGDTVTGGEQAAKAGVINYERNVRFGHYHTFQVYTKTSPIDVKMPKTGIAVPCLCTKDVGYGRGKPNRWVQGFLWGHVADSGAFADHVSVIVSGHLIVNGKHYKG